MCVCVCVCVCVEETDRQAEIWTETYIFRHKNIARNREKDRGRKKKPNVF